MRYVPNGRTLVTCSAIPGSPVARSASSHNANACSAGKRAPGKEIETGEIPAAASKRSAAIPRLRQNSITPLAVIFATVGAGMFRGL